LDVLDRSYLITNVLVAFVAFGCLPFAGFGSCTVKLTTHLPALRVFSFPATTAQFFLEELATVMVTFAFGDTTFTPTFLAKALGTRVFLPVIVLAARSFAAACAFAAAANAAELSTTGAAGAAGIRFHFAYSVMSEVALGA
jgi:hypothetical protein